jgi:hypothetical protein
VCNFGIASEVSKGRCKSVALTPSSCNLMMHEKDIDLSCRCFGFRRG